MDETRQYSDIYIRVSTQLVESLKQIKEDGKENDLFYVFQKLSEDFRRNDLLNSRACKILKFKKIGGES